MRDDPTSFSTFFWVALLLLVVVYVAVRYFSREQRVRPSFFALRRFARNPLFGPRSGSVWESEAAFNPGAVLDGSVVHLFYRALGSDGVSRIGYARSADGMHFEREDEPVFMPRTMPAYCNPFAPKKYDRGLYASGGGWGGAEDPRAVCLGDRIYLTFSLFESWNSIRMCVTSISLRDLRKRSWNWSQHVLMSPKQETHKNWVLFPEKIRGKFAILHALTPSPLVDYIDSLEELNMQPIKSNNRRGGRAGHWDSFVRGAAAPPIKTDRGWLLLYHGMNPDDPVVGYRVGAMLLDLEDPSRVLYRTNRPVLEPSMPYENDWKPGVVYASGAVVKNGTLFIYYGGGDKTVNLAMVPLDQFLDELSSNRHVVLETRPVGLL